MFSSDKPSPFKNPFFLAFLFFAAAFLAYSSSLQGGFIWDDDHYLTQNPLLSAPHGLWKIWFTNESVQYYPMVFTTFWLEKRLWGLDPLGYHFTNIFLHVANAGLLGLVLKRLRLKSAWLVAGLFALHPVHVESVAWITERKNVLSGFFFLSSLLAYLRYEDERGKLYYIAALVAFILGLFSKTVICTLPAVILVLRWMRGEKFTVKAAADLAPFFLAGLGMGLVTVFYEKYRVGASGAEWEMSVAQHLILAGRIPWFYAMKLVWPLNLMFIYPRWELDARQILQWMPVLGLAGLFAVLWLKRGVIGRGPVAGLAIFVGALFPALGFFNVYPMRYSFVADHFQYLASAAALCLIVEPLAARPMLPARFARALIGAVFCLLGFLTWKQGLIYASAKTVWEDTARKNPGAIIAYNNLGAIYIEEKDYGRAGELFRHILTVMPGNAEAHHNLADAYAGQGNVSGAIEHLERAIALNPNLSKPHFSLGRVRALQGDFKGAEDRFREALRLEPGNIDTIYNMGLLYQQFKKSDLAELYYGKAVELDPNHVPARYNLGGLYYARGDYRKAQEQFAMCLALAPGDLRIAGAEAKARKKFAGGR